MKERERDRKREAEKDRERERERKIEREIATESTLLARPGCAFTSRNTLIDI